MATAIFHTAFVGDLLLAIPLLKRAKAIAGTEPVTLICRPGFQDFFVKTGIVDSVFELNKSDGWSVREFHRLLRTQSFDRIICPHQSFRSAWLLLRHFKTVRVGYESWWNNLFFNERVVRPMNLPEPLRLFALLAPFDEWSKHLLENAQNDGRWHNSASRGNIVEWAHAIPKELSLFVEAVDADETLEKFKICQPYVIVAPSSQWNTKRWTASGYSELIQRIRTRGINVYMCGTREEAVQIDEILSLVSPIKSNQSHNDLGEGSMRSGAAEITEIAEVRSLAGNTSLLELHALMSRARTVIANDSGPMHLAAAAGAKVIGIFGPTTLDLGYRPWTDDARVVQIDLDCRPCGKHGHQKCPIGTHDCMKKISANDIAELV